MHKINLCVTSFLEFFALQNNMKMIAVIIGNCQNDYYYYYLIIFL